MTCDFLSRARRCLRDHCLSGPHTELNVFTAISRPMGLRGHSQSSQRGRDPINSSMSQSYQCKPSSLMSFVLLHCNSEAPPMSQRPPGRRVSRGKTTLIPSGSHSSSCCSVLAWLLSQLPSASHSSGCCSVLASCHSSPRPPTHHQAAAQCSPPAAQLATPMVAIMAARASAAALAIDALLGRGVVRCRQESKV